MKVLVVDDDTHLRNAAVRTLRASGNEVLEASTGEECLRRLDEGPQDLILMDVVLPDADGRELCKQITNRALSDNPYVLLISGLKTGVEDKIEGLEAGSIGYLTRPLSNSELSAWVSALLKLKKTEQPYNKSLDEKNILLRELYHRTHNNLSLIQGIINLRAEGCQNEEIEEFLKDIDNRIQAIALVQQKLYQAKDLSKIVLSEFIEELSRYILHCYISQDADISLTVDAEAFEVPVDTAIPFGLALTEFVTNAVKHAFRGKSGGNITLTLRLSDEMDIVLRICDNGTGIAVPFDFRNLKTSGIPLAVSLVECQMNGHLTLAGDNGVCWEIAVPLSFVNARI
jgi:two-component sensor histidine kinase